MRRIKRTLVTGGAGFVGSHLCDRLIARGHRVICVDNFFTGQRKNIEHLIGHPRFELIEHDIVAPLHVDVDQIYNLACPASPIHYQFDPIHTMKTNVLGALNMLGIAKRTGAAVLQASTSEVYGDPEILPLTEDYRGNVSTTGPRACYDEGKRAAEALFFDYHRRHGVPIRIARIFNTYGPRMDPEDGRVVSNFIVQALRGEPLTIYGDGSQTRAFCYVDDLVDALMRLMELDAPAAGPMNLGNPGMFTVRELADMVLRLTGSKAGMVEKPLPVDDPRKRRPDIGMAVATLDWRPSMPLAQGLIETIAYFREALEGEPRPQPKRAGGEAVLVSRGLGLPARPPVAPPAAPD